MSDVQISLWRLNIMKDMTGIPGYRFIKTCFITKGLSGDKKFYLETEEGVCLLARITECSEYERKKAEYKLLQKAITIGIPMPMPVAFGYCEDKSKVYTLLTWVDGEDARKALPKLSYKEQYRVGLEAGRILRKLHDNGVTQCSEDWKARYVSIIEPMLMVNKEAQQNKTRTARPATIPYSKRSHKNLEQ